ncbi:peptidoglycan recognition family protein [Lipingzhangella sp. LS1_29]|uniref:Peptidoglycan recognition family protein n=1 Tax=Lipingzhangella rawalii TaxID=2055835 RepID=A0ABU2H814_9ACTN|nr:peptidoglycan recognition family protein [Lipingzhangella rawalii]MDS1271448.1 peptidoglycan recognition family protein [Lipingzhangella rawalii]
MCDGEDRRGNAAYSRRGVVRGAVLVAGGTLLGSAAILGAASGASAAATPGVLTREDWDARSPRKKAQVLTEPPDHIVIHHTATANTSDFSRSRALSLSRGIQNWHMDNNGWNDTGQQLTISRGGYVMEGRNTSLEAIAEGKHVVGAHVANHNSHTLGIENEGSYGSASPPEEQLAALVATVAWLCAVYELDPEQAIVGHRDFNATACPGDELYALLPSLRTEVCARMAREGQRRAQSAPVAEENRPAFPDVPDTERSAPYFHGPALGEEEDHR